MSRMPTFEHSDESFNINFKFIHTNWAFLVDGLINDKSKLNFKQAFDRIDDFIILDVAAGSDEGSWEEMEVEAEFGLVFTVGDDWKTVLVLGEIV